MRIYTGTEIEYMYTFLYCSKGTGNKYTYLCSMNEMKGSMHTVTEPGKKWTSWVHWIIVLTKILISFDISDMSFHLKDQQENYICAFLPMRTWDCTSGFGWFKMALITSLISVYLPQIKQKIYCTTSENSVFHCITL